MAKEAKKKGGRQTPLININYVIAFVLVVGIVSWMASGIMNQPPPEEPAIVERVNDRMKSVLVREFYNAPTARIVRLSGTSQEERRVTIKAELSSKVESINIVEGAEVGVEDSIMLLEQEESLARLRQAEAQQNNARLEYESQRRLLEQQLTSEATMARASAGYAAARASTSLARKQHESTAVTPPFAGRVERILVEEGDLIQTQQSLAEIFDYDPLRIVGDLSELEVGYINPNNTVLANFITGERVPGEVAFIARTADPQARTFAVEVEVPNPDLALNSGLTVELEFFTGNVDAVQIPASIINIDPDGNLGVRAVNDANRVVFYPVEIIKAETNQVWVDGIPDGTRVITRGFGFVNDDELVEVRFEENIAN